MSNSKGSLGISMILYIDMDDVICDFTVYLKNEHRKNIQVKGLKNRIVFF